MKVSQAFDGFESALKSMRAAEIAALGALGAEGRDAASELASALDHVRVAAVRLWSLPATGPSDLVLKARAARVVPPGPDALCPICMSRVDLEESPIPGVEHLVLSPHRHDSAMCLGTGKTVMHAAQVASRKVQAIASSRPPP